MRYTEYTVEVETANGETSQHKVMAFSRDEALMQFFQKANRNPAIIKGAVKWGVV